MKHGGARPNSGRKSKAEENNLRDKLKVMEEDAIKQLHNGIKHGEQSALKMFFEYFYGKPTDKVDLKMDGELEQKITVEIVRNNTNK